MTLSAENPSVEHTSVDIVPPDPRPRNRRTHHHVSMELHSAEQRALCLKLRMEGRTVRQIAAEVGLSPSRINQYIQEALRAGRAATAQLGAQVIEQTHANLQAVVDRWIPVATGQGHPDDAARAAKRVLGAVGKLLVLHGQGIAKELSWPQAKIAEVQAPDPEPAKQEDFPDDDPAGKLVYHAFQDVALRMSRAELLPGSSYDDAWDALEGLRPGKYQPASREVEDYLRANWRELMAFRFD